MNSARIGRACVILAVAVTLISSSPLRSEEPQPRARSPFNGTAARFRVEHSALLGPAWTEADASEGADGARWKIKIGATDFGGILGRPSRILINGNFIFTPFGNCLLQRLVETGRPLPNYCARLPVPPEQVVKSWGPEIACTLDDHNDQADNKVLLFSSVGGPYEMSRLVGQKQTAWRVLAQPYGPRLVICSDDGWIRLWDTPFMRLLARFRCDSPDDKGNPVRGEFVAFSPFSRWLATVHKNEVSLRTAGEGVKVALWQPELDDSQGIKAIRFDNNGNNVLAFIEDKKEDGAKHVRFLQLNVQTHAENRFEGTRGATWGFSLPEDKTIVTYNGSPEITVWDVEKREESRIFNAAPEHVYDVQLAPSWDTVATVGDDNVVKFWNAAADWKQRESKLNYKHEGAKVIKFSPDGKYLVTLSDDGWLNCWDAPDFAADHSPTLVRTGDDEATGVHTEYYSDGSVKQRFPNWGTRETRPDGTVKVYTRQ